MKFNGQIMFETLVTTAVYLGVFGVLVATVSIQFAQANDYAEKKLVQMAKYRNRLVHFYAQITKQELFDLLQHNLGDFDLFLTSVKNLLAHPEKFNLVAE